MDQMMDMLALAVPVLKVGNFIGVSYVLMATYIAGLHYFLRKLMNPSYHKTFCALIVGLSLPLIMFREMRLNDNVRLFNWSTLRYYFYLSLSLVVTCYFSHYFIEPHFDTTKSSKNVVILFLLVFTLSYIILKYTSSGTIKIGVLHALTGDNNSVEQPVVDLLEVLVDDLNKEGGINGKTVVLVKYDTKSDLNEYVKGAQYFMDNNIKTVFGGWSSVSRKLIKPVFEKHNGLLIYPSNYEGQECSPNIIYSGCVPNQHVETGLRWTAGNLGTNLFLLGSDSVYSRTINQIIKNMAPELDCKILGEEYLPLDTDDQQEIDRVLSKIMQHKNCIVINTCRALSLPTYFKRLYEKYEHVNTDNTLVSSVYPNICFTLSNKEIKGMDIKDCIGHYSVAGYLQTIMTFPNMMFIMKVAGHKGMDAPITDAMHATMQAFNIWSIAVSKVGNHEDIVSVRNKMYESPIRTPSGMAILTTNNHMEQGAFVGKVNQKKQFDIVFNTIGTIEPNPWSNYIPESKGYLCNVARNGEGPRYKEGPLNLEI